MKLNVTKWSPIRLELLTAVSAFTGLLVIGTVVYHLLEGWSWLNSFYFSACTLTTVGYGDFVPTTDLSRLFTAFYVLSGVSIAFATFSLVGARYIQRGERILFRTRGPQ